MVLSLIRHAAIEVHALRLPVSPPATVICVTLGGTAGGGEFLAETGGGDAVDGARHADARRAGRAAAWNNAAALPPPTLTFVAAPKLLEAMVKAAVPLPLPVCVAAPSRPVAPAVLPPSATR